MKIRKILARSVYDSRGNPTVEAEVTLHDGSTGRAAVPSGASVGSREVLELRDGGKSFGGKGVSHAVDAIQSVICPALLGRDASDQNGIDVRLCELDGTDNKGRLGANAILAVSLAVAKAEARHRVQPLYAYVAELAGNAEISLPMPLVNIFNGGKHADSLIDIQECMIVPLGAADFSTGLRMCSEVFHSLGALLKNQKLPTAVGDEGGYAAPVPDGVVAVLELIGRAVTEAGYRLGDDIALALDVAASELYQDGKYIFGREGKSLDSAALARWYEELRRAFPVVSIEDPFFENDWSAWTSFTSQNSELQIVGDDLLVTNPKIIREAIAKQAANAVLIKPNQIGTLSETIEAVQVAQHAGWRTIMSHRSGETEDTTIAHLAVGLGTGQIKSGSMSRTDRLAKYNELIRIEERLGLGRFVNPFHGPGL